MKKKGGIFNKYKVIDFAIRKEFQKKGYVHYHCMLWNVNGPNLIDECKDSEDKCIKFIHQFISCGKSSKYNSEEIRFFQEHRHTFTCYKKNRCTKKNNHRKICRFGIPFFLMRKTEILYPLDLDKNIEKEKYEKISNMYNRIKEILNQFAKKMPSPVPTFDQFMSIVGVSEDEYIECI